MMAFFNNEMQVQQHQWKKCLDHRQDYGEKKNFIRSASEHISWLVFDDIDK